jgi:hypothetical protein
MSSLQDERDFLLRSLDDLEAERAAGTMKHPGRMWVLAPREDLSPAASRSVSR